MTVEETLGDPLESDLERVRQERLQLQITVVGVRNLSGPVDSYCQLSRYGKRSNTETVKECRDPGAYKQC